MSERSSSWPLVAGDFGRGRDSMDPASDSRNAVSEKSCFENISSPVLGMKRTLEQTDIELHHPRPKRHHSVGFIIDDVDEAAPSREASPQPRHAQNQELASLAAKESVMKISHIISIPKATEAAVATSAILIKPYDDGQQISFAAFDTTPSSSEYATQPKPNKSPACSSTRAGSVEDQQKVFPTVGYTTPGAVETLVEKKTVESPSGCSQLSKSGGIRPGSSTLNAADARDTVAYIKAELVPSPPGIADVAVAGPVHYSPRPAIATSSIIDLTEESGSDAATELYHEELIEGTAGISYDDSVFLYNNDTEASEAIYDVPNSAESLPNSPNYAPSEMTDGGCEPAPAPQPPNSPCADDLPDYEFYEGEHDLPTTCPDAGRAGDAQDPNTGSDTTRLADSVFTIDRTAETSFTAHTSTSPVTDVTHQSAARKSINIEEAYDDTLSEDSEYNRYVEESVAALAAAGVSPNSRVYSERERRVAQRLHAAQSEATRKRMSTIALADGIRKMMQRAKDIHDGQLPREVYDVLVAESNAKSYATSAAQTDPISGPPAPSRDELYERDLDLIRRPDGPLVPVEEHDVIQVRSRLRPLQKIVTQKPALSTDHRAQEEEHVSAEMLTLPATSHKYTPGADTPRPRTPAPHQYSPRNRTSPNGPNPTSIEDSDSESTKYESWFVPCDRDARSSFRTGGGSSAFAYTTEATIIDSSSDDGDEPSQTALSSRCDQKQVAASIQPHPLIDSTSFYGYNPHHPRDQTTIDIIDRSLRYQDRAVGHGNQGQYPEPCTGHRLLIDSYLDDIDSSLRRDPDVGIKLTLQQTSWGVRNNRDDGEHHQHAWTRHGYSHYRGLPLVEDVVFLAPDNRAKPDGDCYWRSISFHLYGSDEHWALVKAEHLAYLHYVLTCDQHPRAPLYRESLNSRFFDTASTSPYGPFKANLWQVLHLPHAWTPALISQVTADLYNICIVTFTFAAADGGMGTGIDNLEVSETSVRGCYNARHVFLAFVDGNHFQPMIPNDYLPWEFRYPRVSVQSTARFSNAPKETSVKGTTRHPWRNDFTKEVMPPVPRLFGCDFEELRGYLGSRPQY